jgi:hypothetical protein
VGVARGGGGRAGQCAGAHYNRARQVKTYRKPKNAACQKSSLFKGFMSPYVEHVHG